MTDEQFQALQEYVYSKGIGNGYRYCNSVLNGRYTDYLSVEQYIEFDTPERKNAKVTWVGQAAYWNQMYHGEKKTRLDAVEFIKLSITNAKDYNKLKNQMGLLLMILAGEIEFKDGGIIPVNNHPEVRRIKLDLQEIMG